jgi:hypothetical protein
MELTRKECIQYMKPRGKGTVKQESGQDTQNVDYEYSTSTRMIDSGLSLISGMKTAKLTIRPIPRWASIRERLILETEDGYRLSFYFSDSDWSITPESAPTKL